MSLRRAINAKCKDCIYDNLASGTWRQQVTLCSVTSCPLWSLRPQTTATIPESTLRWYGVDSPESQAEDTTPAPGTRLAGSPCNNGESRDSQTNTGEIGEVAG